MMNEGSPICGNLQVGMGEHMSKYIQNFHFGSMNIHLPPILLFTTVQGFAS